MDLSTELPLYGLLVFHARAENPRRAERSSGFLFTFKTRPSRHLDLAKILVSLF